MRERATDIVTLELGRQTEQEVSRSLEGEVETERFTRLDRMLIAEQEGRAEVVDLRPDKDMLETARRNRALLIARARKLESMRLATEVEVGRWSISGRAEPVLRELGERGDIIKATAPWSRKAWPRRAPSPATCSIGRKRLAASSAACSTRDWPATRWPTACAS